MTDQDFAGRLASAGKDGDAVLGELLQAKPAGGEIARPERLLAAMRHATLAGGKRLRPFLVIEAARLHGAEGPHVLRAAAAIECVHCYSLVHDDLPAMDDDDLRRGRATCHIRFSEATAILAGDALQALAFQTIAEEQDLDAGVRVALVGELARAAGTPVGMVAGQADDLAAESRTDVTGEELDSIHRRKTGAMIAHAARCGAIIAGADSRELECVTNYARQLGLLFQITDDLLDVTATVEDLGKTPGKDARAAKATYPALYGLEVARARAHAVYDEACASLLELERPTQTLRAIAGLILERQT